MARIVRHPDPVARRLLGSTTECGWRVSSVEEQNGRWLCALHRGDHARFERPQWVADRLESKKDPAPAK